MTVYIIILHYKNIEDTTSCLESVVKLRRDGLTLKIILVNNGSTSEESELLPLSGINLPPSEVSIDIIHNLKNLGYAGGVNVGIKEALKDKQTAYILILNNDTILPPRLLLGLLKQPNDIVSPVIKFNFADKWIYDYGGKINWWTGRTKHLESTNLTIKQFNNLTIDYASGCCMLVRRAVFEEIGLFDESYFFYFEDVDFCTRAQRQGFEVAVNPKVAVYHKLGGSIGRWTNKAIFHNVFGNFIFISKHLGWRRPVGYAYLLLLTAKIVFDKLWGSGEN